MGGDRIEKDRTCPCGRGRYAQCCSLLHAGQAASTAVQLMRARYSAYALRLDDYVLATWHPSTRPASVGAGEGGSPIWLGLNVKQHEAQGEHATVEFVARYRVGGRGHRLHEVSRFVREGGRWYYVDGEIADGNVAG